MNWVKNKQTPSPQTRHPIYREKKMSKRLLLWSVITLVTFAVGQEGPPHPVQGSVLDSVALPGQFWSANGTFDPVEHGDVITESYFEQGATVWSTASHSYTITPYVGFGFSYDSSGYSYNDKVLPIIGVKLNKYFQTGVISAGTSLADEHRFHGGSASARSDFVQYWFGWAPLSELKSRFPGSSWGNFGNISPVEHGNYILTDYVTQGFVARRFGASKTRALMPFVDFTVSKDTKGDDWENKVIGSAGVKYGVPSGEAYTEFGIAATHESRFDSGMTANGLKVFVDFSYAWNLFGRRAANVLYADGQYFGHCASCRKTSLHSCRDRRGSGGHECPSADSASPRPCNPVVGTNACVCASYAH